MTATELKNTRKTLGLTQENLAERMGVTVRTIKNYEKGELIPESKVILLKNIFEAETKKKNISSGKILEAPIFKDLPFVSVKARAGFIEALTYSQTEYYPTEETYPVLMEPGENYVGNIIFEIDGDSMEPLFISKTKVRAKPVVFNDWNFIPSGIYIVNYANTYITIKRVKTNDLQEKGYLELHPENMETAGSQKIRREDINNIWKVVSVVYAPVR